MNYSEIQKKYSKHLKNNESFEDFLQKILKKHFEEETVIDQLFSLRYEDNQLISDKEIEIMGREEEIYEKLILLCGKENKSQLDQLFTQIEENQQELLDIYTKEFYKFGIQDARSFKKHS